MRRLLLFAMLAMVVGLLFSTALPVSNTTTTRQHPSNSQRQFASLLTPRLAAMQRPQLAGDVLGSGDLVWHGGQVEEQPRVFLIFWGFAWNNGSDGLAPDAALVQDFFNAASNTPYQTMLAQYGDDNAAPSSTLTIGGVWLDSKNPPVDSQTCGGPTIEDSTIQNEIAQAISANGWPSDVNSSYLIYTPNGYFVNQGGGPAFCSEQQFCAYHGMSYTAQVPYGVIPFPTGEAGSGGTAGCMIPNSPNNNLIGDSLVNLSSVEQANIATDPHLDSYFDNAGFEIADKCAWNFSTGLLTLASGDAFLLQTEYSNQDHACLSIISQQHKQRQGPGTVTQLSAVGSTHTIILNQSHKGTLIWRRRDSGHVV